MNRETKRMLQRQGELGPDGTPARTAPRQAPRASTERTSPRQFMHEVRGELRKVAWPSQPEIVRYSTVVVLTLVVLTGFIAGCDFLFAKGVLFLYEQ